MDINSKDNVDIDTLPDHQVNLAGSTSEVVAAQVEEANSEDNAVVKNLNTYACGLCMVSFLKHRCLVAHLKICRAVSGYNMRKLDMLKNIDNMLFESLQMETKDECFCCGESYKSCHHGHIKCERCAKSFKQQSSYERHIFLTHAENPNFPCPTCNATMRTLKFFKLHEYQHKKHSKRFICKTCSKEFTKGSTLKRHQKYYCSHDPVAKLRCKVCDIVHDSLDDLNSHMKEHAVPPRPKKADHICQTCGKRFCGLNALNIHNRVHSGEKPFACDLCSKSFSILASLKKHRRYHLGEKPFKCNFCTLSFAANEILQRHLKMHSRVKDYMCDKCGKTFRHSFEYRNHEKTHEHPLSCSRCNKEFKSQNTLDRHLKSHNRCFQKQFTCDICELKFDYFQYKAHMKENHIRYVKDSSNLDIVTDHTEDAGEVNLETSQINTISEPEEDDKWNGGPKNAFFYVNC